MIRSENLEKNYKYAIRKTTLGVGSIAIAAILAGNITPAQAAEEAATGLETAEVSRQVTDALENYSPQDDSKLDTEALSNPASGEEFDMSQNTAEVGQVDPEAPFADLEEAPSIVRTEEEAQEPTPAQEAPSPVDPEAPQSQPDDRVETTPDPKLSEGADLTAGESTSTPKVSTYAVAQPTEPNYAEDEKKVGEYRDTQLTRGKGPTFSTSDPSMDFKDGFRYKTLEPSETSPDKTKWGIEFEFDKEKGQRTYTDFAFSNTGNMATYLYTGTVPANKVGEKISEGGSFKDANYKAESLINIDSGSRILRTLNLYATVKDLEHINSIENENTTIGWKGNYSKDPSKQPDKATQGASSSFSFTVNPWPNENDQLSLITLTGSHNEKVYVNGQTVTTGVTVSNLDDSARKRLVGQVYHPETGQVVPGASAYINDKDEVVIEMPKGAVNDDGSVNKDSIFYKDKSYTGLQNLRVKFFARPRTADEFQAATGEYGVYISTGAGAETISHKGEEVVIDKQGIARYDHYNIIGEFSLNLDDTKDHDQDYIDEDGVKTSTSEVSYVRAGIPYIIKNNTQESTDDITDAVGRKHASASLDTSFLDKYNQGKEPEDQWKIESNDSITEIKITPPKSAKALDYMPFSIRYTYTNGSVDVHKVSLIVKESGNNIPQYYSQVLYPTETETSQPHFSIKAEDQEKRKPVEYTIEKDTYTDDHGNEWTASIDTEKGIVTVKPTVPKDFIGGEKLVVPVTAHYVEEKNPEIKFTEEVRAAFVIKQKENLPPRYDAKNGKAGETLTSKPIVKQDGGVDTRTPTSYSIAGTEYKDNKGNTWTVSIDKETGIVTANIPNIKDGDQLDETIISVPVTAHYEEDNQYVGTREATAQFLASGTNNTIEHKEEIPFDYDVEYDPNFYTNYPDATDNYKIVKEGTAGSKTTRYTIENSKIVNEEVIEKTDPVNGVIKVGQKDGEFEYTDKEVIPYDTKVTINPDLAPNEIKEITAGETGLKERTVKQKYTNGELGEQVVGEYKTTKEPVTRVIEVGSNTKGHYKEQEIIPFKTEVRKDPSLKKGEWKYAEVDGVPQTGENGLKERTVTIENSLVTAESEYKTITEPKNAVILVGEEDFTGTVEYVDKDPVPFETEVTIDPSLEPNQIVEDQAGVLGEKETKVTRKITNGEAGEEVRGKTTQTIDPVNRKIRIGAKSNGTHTIEEKVEVPFEVEIQFDDNLKPGEQVVSQEGVPGEKTRTTTLTIVNGEVTETKSGEFTETTAPTKKIIKVGSNTEGKVEHKEELPFKYKVEEVDTLKKGEYKIVKAGKVGTKTTTWTIENSKVVGEPTEEIVPAEDALIQVGKGTNSGTHEVVEKVPVPFETVIEFDDNLAPGETKVVTEGSLGEKTRKNTLTIEDGKVTETKEGKYEQNIAPVNRVIKVGRNTNGKVEHKEEIPFKYTIEYDPNLESGKYVEETPGKVGERTTTWTIENSKVVGEPSVVETQPVDAVIKVGSKNFTGTFKTTKTEPVKFETEYVVNNQLKPGEVNVKQEGQLGEKETPVTHTIVNGAVTKSEEGETKQTKAPVKRIVEVGPGKTDGTYTYTNKKPFDVEVRVNPNLPKGEHKVIQEGVEGEEEVTVTIENSKVTETSEPKETKAPVNEIIEVGSEDYTGTFETKKTSPVEFETEYVVDNSLEPGTTVVEQEGSLGEEETTVTHKIENGKVVESTEGEKTQTKAPTKRIVKVGPAKTDGTHTYTNKKTFEVEVRVNPELPKGEYKVVQKGVEGEEEYTITIENSKVTETSEPRETKAPVNEIIEVGSQDFTGVATHTEEFTVPYKVEIKQNPNLPVGSINTIQDGVDGSYKITYKQDIKNGETVGELTKTESDRVEAKPQIIEIGTKPVDSVEKDVSTEVGVDVIIKDDPELDLGKSRTGELIPGKVENVVKTVYNPETGKMETVENKVVTPAKQIIYVGTKDLVGTQEFTVTQPIPFETEYVEDPTLAAGEKVVDQKGENGSKDVTYKAEAKNGQVTSHKATEEITKEPVKQIIRIGTKSEKTNTEVVKESIPFEIEYEYTDELEAGKIEVKQEGVLGEKTITTTTTIVNGEESTDRKEETTKEPVKRIVRVGTKIDRQSKDVVGEETTIIPYKTTVIYDPTLKAGEKVVDKQGENGERKITVTVPVKDGVAGEPIVKTEDIKLPVNEVIRVGTRDDSSNFVSNTNVITEAIPFETRYEEDPNLAIGETKIETPGQFGSKTTTTTTTIVNGEAKTSTDEKVTKEPVTQVVKIGTKLKEIPNQNLEESKTIKIPFTTIIKYNDKMDVGSSNVAQEGENGETTITTKVTVENGVAKDPEITTETTKEAKPRIIEIGTKELVREVKSEVAFETEVIFDDTLPAGEKKVESGVVGEKTTTITHKLVDGQVVTDTKTEITKEPKNQIVRVGTKTKPVDTKDVTKTIEVEIPYETQIIYDDTLPSGTEEVVQNGEVGKREITVTVPIKDGVAGEAVVSKDEVVTEAKPKIIRVGTLCPSPEEPEKPADKDIVSTTTVEIPFETEITYDPSLEAGKVIEDQKGVTGERTITTTVRIKDGVTGEPITENKVTREPVTRKIRIGKKKPEAPAPEAPKETEGEVTKTIEREIPFETKVIYDENLDAGNQIIEKEGKPGKEEVTITQKVKDSKPVGDPTETTKTITEKEDRVVIVGTKAVVKEVEFGNDTEYRHNPDLPAGETKVIEEGSKGSVKYTTTFNKETGKLEVTEERVEPKNKVVEYGSKTEGEFTYESEQAYDIIIRENPNLEAGKTNVIQEGIVGKTETTVRIENSKEVSRDTKTITEKQDKIIEIGTKNVCEIPPEKPGEDPKDPEIPGEDPKDPEQPGEDPKDPEQPGEDPKDPEPNPGNPSEETPGNQSDPSQPEDPRNPDVGSQEPPAEDADSEEPGSPDKPETTPAEENPGNSGQNTSKETEETTPVISESESHEAKEKDQVFAAASGDDNHNGSDQVETQSTGHLPDTGETDPSLIFGASVASILAGLGLVHSSRRKDE